MHLIHKIRTKFRTRVQSSGQSFVELTIILPLLLLMLIGMVEVAFTMFAYMTALDLSREAARFASTRDFNFEDVDTGNTICDGLTVQECACEDTFLHYYRDTACFYTDPTLNPFFDFDPAKYDDVVVSVLTIADNTVHARHPDPVWSLNGDNWTKDCQGNVVRSEPFFTDAIIASDFVTEAPDDRGLVIVESYICYDLILPIPLLSDFIKSPFRIHAYTIMPASEAIPTPTPIP